MRHILLAMLLSACSTYPVIHWPDTAGSGVTPALLPQAELAGSAAGMDLGVDPGAALAGRAAALRGWAAAAQPAAAQPAAAQPAAALPAAALP